MLSKISSTLFLILSISISSNASELNESFQKQLLSIKSMSSTLELAVTCQKLNEISNKVEKEIFEKSCPTSSDMDFNLCQQSSDTLSLNETKKLQIILSEVKTMNSENCMSASSSVKIITASN